jgi:hypothetical protein
MPVDEKMKKALDRKSLSLPARPPVETIESEHYEDSSGQDSLEIWVILSDSTPDEDLTGENVMQIKSAIRESLRRNGIRLFPYVRLVKRSDYHSETTSE